MDGGQIVEQRMTHLRLNVVVHMAAIGMEHGPFELFELATVKQLKFLQHIMTIMEANGRAGVFPPDNVLSSTSAQLRGKPRPAAEQPSSRHC